MTSQYETESPHAIAELVNGIVDDAQEVIKQQLKLFQAELKTTVRNHSAVVISIVLGLGALLVAAIAIALAVAYGMASAWQMPLWAALAIVGGIALIGAAAFAMWAWAQFSALNSPDAKAPEELKEDRQWTTK
jgi:Putative Actinobacterial Holin-X, holin superfamily III